MKLSKVNFLKFNKWFYYFRIARKFRRKRRKAIKHYIKEKESIVLGHLIAEGIYECNIDTRVLILPKALRYLAMKYKAKFEWEKTMVGYGTYGYKIKILK